MKIKLVLLLFILPLFCKAQTENDHLEPEQSFWDFYNYQVDYYTKVREKLSVDHVDSPEIRLFVMPSFTPENMLLIEESNKINGKYYLVYRIGDKMIWYNKDWENVRVKEFRMEIDSKSVELIRSLFLKALYQTRYYKEETFGKDGTTYHFSAWDWGMKSGTVWSPSTPKMTKLVEIGNDLIELAKSGKEKVAFDKVLIGKIEKLMKELEE